MDRVVYREAPLLKIGGSANTLVRGAEEDPCEEMCSYIKCGGMGYLLYGFFFLYLVESYFRFVIIYH